MREEGARTTLFSIVRRRRASHPHRLRSKKRLGQSTYLCPKFESKLYRRRTFVPSDCARPSPLTAHSVSAPRLTVADPPP